MEEVIKRISKLKFANRWDYRFHQRMFFDLEQKLDASKYPLYSVKQITEQVIDGTHFTPQYTDNSGVLFLMARNVRHHEITLKDISYITQDEHQKLIRCKPEPGDVLVTKDGTIGVAAVVPETLPEFNIFVSVIKIRPKQIISPHYLAAFINSELGQLQIKQQIKGAAITHIHLEDMRKIRIPVPPRSIQDQIAQVMQEAYRDRYQKLEQSKKLLQNIDKYIFGVLNISPDSVEEDKRFLKPISTIRGGRFDVEFNMGFHKFDPYMERVSLMTTIATFPKETQDPTRTPEAMFNYIDIASVDIELGEIREVSKVLGVDAPSRARQIVRTGDIIISTVRPTRGAIALIPESMDGFICSTGFSIVRPKDKMNSEYLHIALLLHTTLEQFGRRSAGSSYPAILDSDIKKILIPVPNQEIQTEISSEIVRRRTEAKRLRSEAEVVVMAAKARVEQMILGEEEITDNG
jgi:type I restriction enzyme, S subunit